jgi:V-type H+-transporting ATPase subunit a
VDHPLYADAHTQLVTQQVLASNSFPNKAIAAICIPVMLFPKPFITAYKASHKGQYSNLGNKPEEVGDEILEMSRISIGDQSELFLETDKITDRRDVKIDKRAAEHGEEELGELMVHQVIETIEFVLGSISNTASYLRLWALSLAHKQLAFVFYDLLMAPNIKNQHHALSGTFGLIVGTTMFMNATFGVILCMDLLECFLHALRLHWYTAS